MFRQDPEFEKKQILNRYRGLRSVFRPSSESDRAVIKKAFHFAAEAHKVMRRKTGEPYIYHPIEVARIVAGEIGLDAISVVCALLHDVVEDTEYTLSDIRRNFGDHVARIIDGLTKIEDIFDKSSASLQAENFRKMLLTLSDDVRVILIKLADRLHNMRTLDALPKEKRLKIASETIYLYAPLAHRLGLYAIKTELEDLALKYTEPEIFYTITEKLRESERERKRFITRFILPLRESMNRQNFSYRILAREKSVYSIWDKMRKKGIPFEEVYDIFAVRVIIDTPAEKEKVDCWRVYSIITDHYRPNIDRLRDWISIPKANGYEALHTTVMSRSGKWVEVQIRTERMEEIAEKGFAAHWKYKEGQDKSLESNIDRWLNRIRDMLQNSEGNALDFVDDFQGFLFTDEIYLFTPKGELRNLPAHSTVLDFAYAIHSDLGNTCIGAKVNHKLAPLNMKLNSGDQVEIITSQKQTPKEEWFGYVVTTRARTQIKNAIKEERKKYTQQGKNRARDLFGQIGVEYNDKNLGRLQQKYNYASPIDLFYDLARELIGIKEVKSTFQHDMKGRWLSNIVLRPFKSRGPEKETLSESVIRQIEKGNPREIRPEELKKISYEVSDCCNPLPGDEIVGFVQPSDAIRIHRTNCPLAIDQMSKYGKKIIKTTWEEKESIGFLSAIKIYAIDRKGFIKEVIKVLTEKMDLNIKSFHLETGGGILEAVLNVYVYSTGNLQDLISNLRQIDDIKKVYRVEPQTEEKLSP